MTHFLSRCRARFFWMSCAVLLIGAATLPVRAEQPKKNTFIFNVRSSNQRLEMTVNTSRILSLEGKIPQAQANNPNLLDLVALSPNQIQISAKAAGVTQVNLWDENNSIYTIDVVILGDAEELKMLLRTQFPNAALKVTPLTSGVLLSGYVDHPEHVSLIVRLAEEYYPKVINNITVSGVQQVLLHLKVMEISRTKLRKFGFDFGLLTSNDIIESGVSGLIGITSTNAVSEIALGSNRTGYFRILNGSSAFYGVLEALREDKLVKTLAEPHVMTISGRPAVFRVGGQFGYVQEGGIMGPTVAFKEYGTRIDFVPIVLGNGRIRLEVRPDISEIDHSLGVNGVPGVKDRVVDCGVELQSGQTLAIAGLIQERTESQRRGLPWASELPYVGALFGRVENSVNEVETLILVTPQLVEAMGPEEVPPCGPGTRTASPDDCELYLGRQIEVPRGCSACGEAGCPECQAMPQNMTPPEGLILDDSEAMHPASSMGQSSQRIQTGTSLNNQQDPQSQYNKPVFTNRTPNNRPPGFLGPVGYDVVK